MATRRPERRQRGIIHLQISTCTSKGKKEPPAGSPLKYSGMFQLVISLKIPIKVAANNRARALLTICIQVSVYRISECSDEVLMAREKTARRLRKTKRGKVFLAIQTSDFPPSILKLGGKGRKPMANVPRKTY